MSRFILLTVLVLCFGGCTYPIFEHPLVDPDSCKPFPELHGKYKFSETDESAVLKGGTMQVGPAGEGFPKGFMKIELRSESKDHPDGKSFIVVVFAKSIGNSYVIHYPVWKGQPHPNDFENQLKKLGNTWNSKQNMGYYFLVLTKTASGFNLRVLDKDFFKDQITSGSLKGKEQANFLHISNETNELKRFFEKTPIEEMSIPFEPNNNLKTLTITKVN